MANFEVAFVHTMGHEGGYVNDPTDTGGETYRGISRVYNPSWCGWKTIDYMKGSPTFPSCLRDSSSLDGDVLGYYKSHYWDKFWGDHIPSAEITFEMFDTAVNMGVGRAVKFLQIALNLLNRNQLSYGDIVVDGGFGNKTLEAVKAYLSKDSPKYIVTFLNILQGMHYIEYMQKSPVQEKYARGWLNRVVINK